MVKQILMEFERGGKVIATLLEEEAPKTCQIIWNSLPVEAKVSHAMFAGEEIFFDDFPISTELDLENETNEIKPGDVLAVATILRRRTPHLAGLEKGYTSFCIFYGKGRPRKSADQTIDLNLFAKIQDVEEIAKIGRRIRINGSEKIRIVQKAE